MPLKLQNSPEFSSEEQCKAMNYKKMDTEALNGMLFDRIHQLEREGLVDEQFRQCHLLKEDNGPSFFLDLITTFLADICRVVEDMRNALKQPVVNFNELHTYCIKLKGSSACFGACRITDACFTLRNAIENNHVSRSSQALNCIKHEYEILHDQLYSVIEIEQEIVSRAT